MLEWSAKISFGEGHNVIAPLAGLVINMGCGD